MKEEIVLLSNVSMIRLGVSESECGYEEID